MLNRSFKFKRYQLDCILNGDDQGIFFYRNPLKKFVSPFITFDYQDCLFSIEWAFNRFCIGWEVIEEGCIKKRVDSIVTISLFLGFFDISFYISREEDNDFNSNF